MALAAVAVAAHQNGVRFFEEEPLGGARPQSDELADYLTSTRISQLNQTVVVADGNH